MTNMFNHSWDVYYIMFFVRIGGFLYGFDIGVISGVIVFIKQELSFSERQLSFIVAAVLGGGSVATLN